MAPLTKILARRTRGFRDAVAKPFRRFAPAIPRAYTEIAPDLGIAYLKSGHRLYVDPADAIVSRRIIQSGHWETWTTLAVLSLLRSGDKVVEVGANLGYYTVLMADQIGDGGTVLALEANPRLAAMIKNSLTLNGLHDRVRVLNQAALDQPGQINFVTSASNTGAGHVEVLAVAPFPDAVTITVEAVRLDDVAPDRVDFIRLDAEGCEPQILRGAEALLLRNPDIIICLEWSRIQIEPRTSARDFLSWMSALGFSFWRIEKDARLAPIAADAVLNLPHSDLVAARCDPRRRQT